MQRTHNNNWIQYTFMLVNIFQSNFGFHGNKLKKTEDSKNGK
jgi:hypothetical protein